MNTVIGRRGFLTGLASALAAPAIVHAGNLMPVRALDRVFFEGEELVFDGGFVTRKAFVPRLLVHLYQQSPLLTCLNTGG